MNPTAELLQPEVRELIHEGRYTELREALHLVAPADVADILAGLEPAERAVGFRFLQHDDAAQVFSYLDAETQEELIRALGADASVQIVEAMHPDDRVKLLDELPATVAQRIVASLSPEERRQTQAILGYPHGTIGRIMTPDYIAVRPGWTIAEALDHIRRNGKDAETINVIYVVDNEGRLIDDMRLRQVLLANPAQTIESLMTRSFSSLRADEDQEEAVRAMARYDRIALPVVDSRGLLVGIVTADDVADVAEAEVTEDIQKLGGVKALDRPYMQTGLVEMLRKRGVGLCVLAVLQTLTIGVLDHFEHQLSRAQVLILFIPLIISSGGNTGTQAASLLLRALILEEIGLSDWWRVLRRELTTGLILGSLLGALGMVLVVSLAALGLAGTEQPVVVGLTVGVAILAIVLWGALAGAMFPFLLRRVGLDPASLSSPMVATLMDVSGLVIYFAVATVIMAL